MIEPALVDHDEHRWLIAAELGWMDQRAQVTFQSRFGRAEWLKPYTDDTLKALGRDGVGRVDVICPGFAADCLETLEEIALEARAAYLGAGGHRERHHALVLIAADHHRVSTRLH